MTEDEPEVDQGGTGACADRADVAAVGEIASPERPAVSLCDVLAAVEALRAEAARHHDRAAARERVIDRLHEDNQQLRAGERQLLLRPYLVDLQRLRDDLLRQAEQLPGEISADEVRGLLASFAVSVGQTLERAGVHVFRPEAGAPFDPSSQRAVGAVATAEPGRDGLVAKALSDGYRDAHTGRVLSPAAVLVSRFDPAAPACGGPPEPAGTDPDGGAGV